MNADSTETKPETIENPIHPDSERIDGLLEEVNEILKKNDWPGVAFVLVPHAHGVHARGFTHLDTETQMTHLLNEGGFRLMQATKIIAGIQG